MRHHTVVNPKKDFQFSLLYPLAQESANSMCFVYLDWPTETGSADGLDCCIITICSDDDDTVDELAESRKEDDEEGPTICCCCCWAAAIAAMAAEVEEDAAALNGARTMVWREEGAVETSEQVSLTREGSRWWCGGCCRALPLMGCF